MKKLNRSLVFIISIGLISSLRGCSFKPIDIRENAAEIDSKDTSGYLQSSLVSLSDNGFYFTDDSMRLNLLEDYNGNVIKLSYLNYADDKAITGSVDNSYTKYIQTVNNGNNGILRYGDYLYFAYTEFKFDGSGGTIISRTDLEGKNKEDILTIDSFIVTFTIKNGKIITIEYNSEQTDSIIKIIDPQNSSLTETVLIEGIVSRLYNSEYGFYYSSTDLAGKDSVYFLTFDDLTSTYITDGSLIAADKDYLSVIRLNREQDMKLAGILYSVSEKKDMLSLEDTVINLIDAERDTIVTSKVKGIQTYSILSLDGNANKSIVIKDKIDLTTDQTEPLIDGIDFWSIVRANEKMIVGKTNEVKNRYFVCSLLTDECKYLE